MNDLLTGFSRGLYSNWLWHQQLQLVVDAGEGLQLGMGSKVLQPTHLLITHGHSDHVLGLPGFVAARRFSLGDPDKPLTVVYPDGAAGVLEMRGVLERLWPNEPFPVRWEPVTAGAALPFGKRRCLHCFAADHSTADAAVGYKVVETRRRLRAEHAGLPQVELQRLAAEGGRDALTEEREHVLLAHTGDTMPLPPELFSGADLLVHDATFLDPADRRLAIHATTEEALGVAREAAVATLVLHHLSVRYERPSAIPRLREQVREAGFAGACWLLDDAQWIPLGGALGAAVAAGG